MRIAIDARELRGKPTGVGRFLGEILAAWKTMPEARAHEFILLAPDGVIHEDTAVRAEAGVTGDGTIWEQLVLPGMVRDAHADVLFAPAYSGPMFPPVPMVVAIHDVSFAAHPEWFGWREGARRRTTVQFAARAAERVLTISQFSKREIVAHLGIDSSKVIVVYPGVTDHGVGSKGEHHTILFVGSVFNRRHVPELITGFARLARDRPNVRLEIVGENRTSPHLDLAGQIRATGLANRIQLRSYVTDDELRALYGDSSAFVFLSAYEGFGLTPLEALAAGLPVLLLDTPVAREICGDAALYVPRADPGLIETALATLLFDTTERTRILDAAQRVLARYSWTDCARDVLQVLVSCG